MAKFQPQGIECPHCGYRSYIVTEDIHKGNLIMLQGSAEDKPNINAQIECPNCRNHFSLAFEWRQTLRDEMQFECVSQPNVGLKMWRWIIHDEPLIPRYEYNLLKRSQSEQCLDQECKKIADEIVGWKSNGGAPGQALEDMLSHAEDYTKGKTWKNFTKKHFMVVVCGNCLSGTIQPGYSGKFEPVHHKNADLLAAMYGVLSPNPDNKSVFFCNNPVGNCAEVHATNSLLYYEPQFGLNNLQYSIAYMTRFGTPRSYCMNCIALFRLNNG